MKQTNKRLLAAGGIFCAVGILFFGVGIASGGRNYVKTADLNRISGTAMMDSGDSHAILSKTEINAFSSVNVDLKNLDLDIKASDDNKFYISYNIETTDGMLPLSYQVQNDALNIVEKNGHESSSYIHIDINFLQEMLGQSHVIENSNKVTVYIPKKTDLSGFSCKMGYGDINVESLNTHKAELQSEDGDITISDSTFKNLELSADLGDLEINDTILTNSQIEMMDGDVKQKIFLSVEKMNLQVTLVTSPSAFRKNLLLHFPSRQKQVKSISRKNSAMSRPMKMTLSFSVLKIRHRIPCK